MFISVKRETTDLNKTVPITTWQTCVTKTPVKWEVFLNITWNHCFVFNWNSLHLTTFLENNLYNHTFWLGLFLTTGYLFHFILNLLTLFHWVLSKIHPVFYERPQKRLIENNHYFHIILRENTIGDQKIAQTHCIVWSHWEAPWIGSN